MPNKTLKQLGEKTSVASTDWILIMPDAETITHYKVKKSNFGLSSTNSVEYGTVSGATTGNYQSTGYTISGTPGGSKPTVKIAGLSWEVGDSVRTKDCYFSNDGGSTAKALGSVSAGDTLYWNGTINYGNTAKYLSVLGNLQGGELIEITY